jgi:hypothetical protein
MTITHPTSLLVCFFAVFLCQFQYIRFHRFILFSMSIYLLLCLLLTTFSLSSYWSSRTSLLSPSSTSFPMSYVSHLPHDNTSSYSTQIHMCEISHMTIPHPTVLVCLLAAFLSLYQYIHFLTRSHHTSPPSFLVIPQCTMAPSPRAVPDALTSSSSTDTSLLHTLLTSHGMLSIDLNTVLAYPSVFKTSYLPHAFVLLYPYRRIATDNETTYDSLKTIFEAGKLAGDDMNQCYLLIQCAAKNFAEAQVTSPHVHITLLFNFPLFLRRNYIFADRSL